MILPTFNPRYRHAKHGVFKPKHPEKYKGHGQIVFKSLLEAKMMFYLDNNPKCTAWWAEPFSIAYFDKSTNKRRQYFIDFVAEIQTEGVVKETYWIETKNIGETRPPSGKYMTHAMLESTKTYIKNLSKWKAASEAAKRHGAKFLVITDDFFKGGKTL